VIAFVLRILANTVHISIARLITKFSFAARSYKSVFDSDSMDTSFFAVIYDGPGARWRIDRLTRDPFVVWVPSCSMSGKTETSTLPVPEMLDNSAENLSA
jgi:hypothetical protein